MPYILQKDRELIDRYPLSDIESAGELNYRITRLIQKYVRGKELRYAVLNDVLGALEGAKLEFYRRMVIPYETLKTMENGDVY